MKIVAAKCPNCGANIDVDKDSDITKCEFCHSKVIVQDAIAKVKIEVSGNVEIKNLPKYENYITLADRYYKELQLKEARSYYKKALEFDPNNAVLLFREKICRACSASYEKFDLGLIDDAYNELSENIEDKKDLSKYLNECGNALAYMVNKVMDYYHDNNLGYYEVMSVRTNINLCALDFMYFKIRANAEDKDVKVNLLNHYIAACNLLTQDFRYKIPRTRNHGVYRVPYKDKKEFVNKIKEAQKEIDTLTGNTNTHKTSSRNKIFNKDYFSREKMYVCFIILFLFTITLGINALVYANYAGIAFSTCLFIYQVKRFKLVKNNESYAKKVNIISFIALIIVSIILSTSKPVPQFYHEWENEQMYMKINTWDAVLKFSNNETVISGKYSYTCDDSNKCTILFGSYKFIYENDQLCFVENGVCSSYLKTSYKGLNLPVKSKSDICDDDVKPTCNENRYYVCSNGVEHRETTCISEEDEKNDETKGVIISAIFAILLLSFIEWATKR